MDEEAQGKVLARRYLVGEEIGRGGMGAVYRATDLHTGGAVAIKVPHPDIAHDPIYRERLRREALTAAALTSPRVVRVIDLEVSSGTPFLVMEYVAGETLQERLRREGRLPAADAVFVVLEIARALEDAHAHGIVHRDLKPHNVKLVDGQVKVLDFGIARAEGLPVLTLPGSPVGTPAYSAPEWASGKTDVRADIYALGVILFALLEGRVPFRGSTAMAVLRQHESAPPPAAVHAPPDVRAVIERCLAKAPQDRYQTPSELVAALRAVAAGLPGSGELQAPRAAATPSQTLDIPPPAPEETPNARRTRGETPGARRTPGVTPAARKVLGATLGAPHNLPAALSSFVGRERQAADVQRLIRGEGDAPGARLVTLTGAGGAGKTRLALHVAAGVLDAFPDGVWLVELASLADATLVPQAVATAAGVREAAGRPLAATLVDALAPRRLLLVLDNCEHLVGASAALAEVLLQGCPQLQILATSREALGVLGETTWPVPALAVPTGASLPVARLAENEAVRLFVERAASISPSFALTERNAGVVAAICRRLDGLPLAIELAAARVRALSPEQIAARLDRRLRLLTSGSRSALPHQQTLRASMDWSYELLAEPERRVFGALATFAGGWALEAAEAVCATDPRTTVGAGTAGAGTGEAGTAGAGTGEAGTAGAAAGTGGAVLDALAGLVDKSLVVAEGEVEGGERRYGLLETVRQYAAEKLAAGRGEAEAQERHAAYFLHLAEEAEPALNGPRQAAWLGRLEREHDNLRAALRWAIASGDAETGLRLGSALAKFWTVRGHQSEGQHWLDAVLLQAGTAAEARRARACYAAGRMARARRDYGAARARYEESLALWRAAGDPQGIALALASLGGVAGDQGETETARARYEESLALRRASGDRRGVAQTLNYLGMLAYGRGDYPAAAALQEESLNLHRELQDTGGVASALLMLGQTAGRQGHFERSMRLCNESLGLFREVGNRLGIAMAQRAVGQAALEAGDPTGAEAMLEASLAAARALQDPWVEAAALVTLATAARSRADLQRAEGLAREGLTLAGSLGTKRQVAMALEILAGTDAAAGRGARAARLFGAAEALRDALGMPRPVTERPRYDADVAAARATLDERELAAQWAAGRALSVEQAIEEAGQEDAAPAPSPTPTSG